MSNAKFEYAGALTRILGKVFERDGGVDSPVALNLMERIERLLFPSADGEAEYQSWLRVLTGSGGPK